MIQIKREFFTKLLNLLLVIAIVASLLGVMVDLRATLRHGGADLRNRVVGARLLVRGLDPYYFKWQPGDSEMLKDPLDRPELPISRVTVPPSSLMLYVPFANLPYFQQRFIWFGLQSLALATSLWLIISSETRLIYRKILLIVGLLFFASGTSWRLHIEVGQIYIFYVLLLAIGHWILSQKFKFNQEGAGLLIGLAASMRFPLIAVVIPMILFKKVRLLTATLLSFLIWLSIVTTAFGFQVWLSYFTAMQTISQLSAGKIKIAMSDLTLPQTLEGVILGIPDRIGPNNSSIPIGLSRAFKLQIPTSYIILIIVVLLLFYSASLLKKHQKVDKELQKYTLDAIFIFGGLMMLIVDFWIPSFRYRYNDVLFIIPLLLTLKYICFQNRVHLYLIGLLSIAFFLANDLFSWIPRSVSLGQVLMLITLIAMSLTIAFPPSIKSQLDKESAHLHT